jgi:hypothetical protein
MEAESANADELREQWSALTRILQLIRQKVDLQQVLDTLLEEAVQLTRADAGSLHRGDAHRFELTAAFRLSTRLRGLLAEEAPVDLGRGSMTGRLALERSIVHIPDALADPEYRWQAGQQAGRFRTMLGVPLLRGGELSGAIVILKSAVQPFTPRQIDLVTSFADQAMVAIENARLVQELRVRTEQQERTVSELQALDTVTRAVSATLERDAVLGTIVASAVELSGATGGVFGDADRKRERFHVRSAQGVEPELLELLRTDPMRLGIDPAADPWAPRQVIDLLDAPASRAHPLVSRSGYRSLLSVPVVGPDRVLGTLALWRREAGAFSAEVASRVETIAVQSAPSLHNAELYREIEEQSRDLARLDREMEQLYRLSSGLQESLSLDEQLSRVLEAACEVVGVERANIWGLAADRGAFRNITGAGFNVAEARSLQGLQIPLAEAGALYHSYRWGTPLLFDDANPLPSALALKPPYSALAGLRTRCFLVVPMIAQGKAVGVIAADKKPSGQPISKEAVERLQFLASHAAIAIENAHLFEEIEEQRRQLEVAGRHKSQFLANMSHELRTPLNAIIGYSEILQEEAEDLGQPDFVPDLQKITSAGRHLLELINAVLDLSKIEAGKMDLYLEVFDVTRLVAEVEAVIRPLAVQNDNRLEVRCPDAVGVMTADLTKVRQSLVNLLRNACTFTHGGTVTVEVARARSAGTGWVTFAVRDTGIGLTSEQLDCVFDEFSQVNTPTTRKTGGSGLGLALSRRLCRLMGGDVTATSSPGVGSTFTIRLPATVSELGITAPTVTEPPALTEADSATVLVIDDDPAARDLVERLLVREGLRVVTAAGGEEGFWLARQLRPTAITLDILMPSVDGWAVLAALKSDPGLADIPVILLTITDDKNLGYALGAADYLSKPIDREALLAVLTKHCAPGAGHVLIVDDDAASRRGLREVLTEEGFATREAEHGRAALAQVARERPALIVLDPVLPEMDGFEFLHELRKRADWRALPVLVVTAADLASDDRRRLDGSVEKIARKGSYDRAEFLHDVRNLVLGGLPGPPVMPESIPP